MNMNGLDKPIAPLRTKLRSNSTPICSALILTLLLAGCTVGPDFRKPAAPTAAGYTSSALSSTTASANTLGGEAQHFTERMDIPGEWWTLFHSKALNEMITGALESSPDLKSAQAALIAANENRLAGQGAFYPSVSASFSATRNRTSSQIAPTPNSGAMYYSLFTPQVSVSYDPDVFGMNHRAEESLIAQEQVARFQLIATHITLSTNLVVGVIQEAALRAQIAATRNLIAVNSNMLQLIRMQFYKGAASRVDVASQESQLAQSEAMLPPLLKQLAQQRDSLRALAGKLPGEQLPEQVEFSDLQLPLELPVSLPSQLVKQRPDVRVAEENLHVASAQLGMARAKRFPTFTLTADVGTMALAIGDLLKPGVEFWDLGAIVTQPIFQGGTLLHQERAAKAYYNEAAQQYRSTVISAFQNVADTLTAIQQDADALKAAAYAVQAAKTALDLSKQNLQTGAASPLSLLMAEQNFQQAQLGLIQAQANRYTDSAALFQSLGGGWWNRADLATAQTENN